MVPAGVCSVQREFVTRCPALCSPALIRFARWCDDIGAPATGNGHRKYCPVSLGEREHFWHPAEDVGMGSVLGGFVHFASIYVGAYSRFLLTSVYSYNLISFYKRVRGSTHRILQVSKAGMVFLLCNTWQSSHLEHISSGRKMYRLPIINCL